MVNVQTLHRRAARVLPEVIKTSGVLLEEEKHSALSALLFPLRRKSSGAILFRIAPETLHAMGNQPLIYLKEATRAREGLGRRQIPFAYREWRMTWIPGHWLPAAAQRFLPFADARITVCFTTKTDGKALVVLVPHAGLAVYLWSD
jgi:hypothetical protein